VCVCLCVCTFMFMRTYVKVIRGVSPGNQSRTHTHALTLHVTHEHTQ
jgi:hypothetical protein